LAAVNRASYTGPLSTVARGSTGAQPLHTSNVAAVADVASPNAAPLTLESATEIRGLLSGWAANQPAESLHELSALSTEQNRLFQAVLSGEKHLVTDFPVPPKPELAEYLQNQFNITIQQQQAYAIPAAMVTLAPPIEQSVVQPARMEDIVAGRLTEGKAGDVQAGAVQPPRKTAEALRLSSLTAMISKFKSLTHPDQGIYRTKVSQTLNGIILNIRKQRPDARLACIAELYDAVKDVARNDGYPELLTGPGFASLAAELNTLGDSPAKAMLTTQMEASLREAALRVAGLIVESKGPAHPAEKQESERTRVSPEQSEALRMLGLI